MAAVVPHNDENNNTDFKYTTQSYFKYIQIRIFHPSQTAQSNNGEKSDRYQKKDYQWI